MMNTFPQGYGHNSQGGTVLWIHVWSAHGRLLAESILGKKTLAFAASDGDFSISELGCHAVFVQLGQEGPRLLVDGQGHVLLRPGIPEVACGLSWLVTTRDLEPSSVAATSPGTVRSGGVGSQGRSLRVTDAAVKWLVQPMEGSPSLQSALQALLDSTVQSSRAVSGMLVLTETRGTRVAVVTGMSMRDAENVWEKMPSDLSESILRSRARIIMPDGIREKVGEQPTVFVKDIRMVVGFPVIAEERVLGILYLNFQSLIRDLSPDLQEDLQGVANVLGVVLQRAILREELAQESIRPQRSVEVGGERLLIGKSPQILSVYEKIERVAPFDVSVLVVGETGTGKELVSREIHRHSRVAQGPFVPVNAAALPENLVESELFGHVKGAFTGAIGDRVGLVEQANGGTLFLDEVAELPLPLQAKLLRVLQDQKVRRVGDGRERAVCFRLVCATNRNLQDMVRAGTFREDLYYRIATTLISLPALRERVGDVMVLANFFKDRFIEQHGFAERTFSTSALTALENHGWSGNVRELQNVVQQSCIMADGLLIRQKDLGFELSSGVMGVVSCEDEDTQGLAAARDAWMRSYLTAALQQHDGNRARTAKSLGIGERTLFRYIEQLGIKALVVLALSALCVALLDGMASATEGYVPEKSRLAQGLGDAELRLQEAEILFSQGQFNEAEVTANRLLVDDVLQNTEQQTRLILLKARMEQAFGRSGGVRVWLGRLYDVNPQAELDAYQDPPSMFALWETIREQRGAAAPPPGESTRKDDATISPPALAPAPNRLAEVEEPLRENSLFWAGLLPFGIGHYTHQDYVMGSAFLAAHVGVIFSVEALLESYQERLDAQEQGYGWNYESFAQISNLELLRWFGFLGLWGHEIRHLLPAFHEKYPNEEPWVRYALSFAPFGVGQLKNGEFVKGMTLAAAEVSFALLSVAGGNERFRSLGTTFLWGAFIYGAYDGWANHRWSGAISEEIPRLAALPMLTASGWGLNVNLVWDF